MTELEMCNTLGILVDPDKNRLDITSDIQQDILSVCGALSALTVQKRAYGSVSTDTWLELIPWHSLN